MFGQAILDLAGANAVSGAGDDVVVAAHIPEITLFIAVSGVTGDQPVADVFFTRGLCVVPIAQEGDGVWVANGDGAGFAVGQKISGGVDNSDVVSGYGATHRPWADVHDRGAIADDEVAFGLAVKLIDVEPEGFLSPIE